MEIKEIDTFFLGLKESGYLECPIIILFTQTAGVRN